MIPLIIELQIESLDSWTRVLMIPNLWILAVTLATFGPVRYVLLTTEYVTTCYLKIPGSNVAKHGVLGLDLL
jgi:hypothetical protein